MTTRSTKLWSSTSLGRPTPIVYTVPDGFTVILKSIFVTSFGSAAEAVQLIAQQPSTNVSVYLAVYDLSPGAGSSWEGWLVLEAGDHVYLNYAAGPINSWGSGAVLPAP